MNFFKKKNKKDEVPLYLQEKIEVRKVYETLTDLFKGEVTKGSQDQKVIHLSEGTKNYDLYVSGETLKHALNADSDLALQMRLYWVDDISSAENLAARIPEFSENGKMVVDSYLDISQNLNTNFAEKLKEIYRNYAMTVLLEISKILPSLTVTSDVVSGSSLGDKVRKIDFMEVRFADIGNFGPFSANEKNFLNNFDKKYSFKNIDEEKTGLHIINSEYVGDTDEKRYVLGAAVTGDSTWKQFRTFSSGFLFSNLLKTVDELVETNIIALDVVQTDTEEDEAPSETEEEKIDSVIPLEPLEKIETVDEIQEEKSAEAEPVEAESLPELDWNVSDFNETLPEPETFEYNDDGDFLVEDVSNPSLLNVLEDILERNSDIYPSTPDFISLAIANDYLENDLDRLKSKSSPVKGNLLDSTNAYSEMRFEEEFGATLDAEEISVAKAVAVETFMELESIESEIQEINEERKGILSSLLESLGEQVFEKVEDIAAVSLSRKLIGQKLSEIEDTKFVALHTAQDDLAVFIDPEFAQIIESVAPVSTPAEAIEFRAEENEEITKPLPEVEEIMASFGFAESIVVEEEVVDQNSEKVEFFKMDLNKSGRNLEKETSPIFDLLVKQFGFDPFIK